MRIIKDFPNTNIEDKFYDVNAPIGILISKLKHSLEDVETFIGLLKDIVYWDYPKISLWAFDDILNYIDSLLPTTSDENRLNTILNFLKILIANSYHKDIFSSFDKLEQIFRQTTSIKVKNNVIEIYLLFSEIKKTIMNNYIEFISQCTFVIPLRPIFTDFLLRLKTCVKEVEKRKAAEEFYIEYEKLFMQIIKDSKKMIENTSNQLRIDNNEINNLEISRCGNLNIDESEFKRLLRKLILEKNENLSLEKFKEIQTVLENSFNLSSEKLINRGTFTKEDELSFNLYYTFLNFFVYSSYLNQNIDINYSSENFIELSKFSLNMLNLLIFTQKNSKIPLISEYYIEKYLKDVLEMLTSKYSQELKSVFLLSTIGFVTYFDGYENILFQNGLFHSILSDMTTPKLDNFECNHELEVLSYEESIDQDFFNAVLLFLYKTSSFKEIPVQFLDKVLELPKENVYPYRIDNVIFSLKKKRTLDENTLNELVIPRLIYELNNFWVDENELKYMTAERKTNQSFNLSVSNLPGLTLNYKKFPSIYERSYLIQKLFKILSSIFEHNTNSSSLRYYESKIINAIDHYIKSLYSKLDELNEVKGSLFEPLLTSCIDFISKICYFLPSKIPSLIEMTTLSTIFEYMSRRIPAQPNVLNLVFHIIATVQLTEDGSKFIQENDFGVKVFDKLFETILIKDEYFLSNVFNQHGFYTDDFYSPYTYFLRVENANNILVHFFKKVHQSIDWLKIKLEKILKNEDNEVSLNEILESRHPNLNSCRFSNRIHLIGQFFMNITQEEKEQLTKNDLIPLEDLVLNYFELVFHPLNLYMLNSTVISTTMVKGVFMNNPEKLLERLYDLMTMNMNVLNIQQELRDISSCESGDNNKMLIDEPIISLTPLHKDKILSKLVHLVEFTTKKLFNLLKDKSIIHKFITRLSVIMIYLVKRQSNVSIYLSPVNDCGLIINRKWYYKFLSSKLNKDLRQILLENTRKKEKNYSINRDENRFENFQNNKNSVSSNILIFDELSCLGIKYKQSFQTNMRVEIVDGNNPFTTELIDNLSKIIINSHMPVLDFYITIGKSIKKNFKNFTQVDVSIVNSWNTLTQSLVLVLSSLDLNNKLKHFKQIFQNKEDDSNFKRNLQEVIETFIYYINILNNINIVIADKIISCYVIIQFVKLGGVEKIFELCLFLLNFCNNLEQSSPNNEYPLILLLLIKNLWNIITSIITRIIKINFENIQNLNLILIKEGFTNAFDFSCYLKSQIAWIVYHRFLDAEMPLKKIATLSYSFHSLIYCILDVCITQWKELMSKDSDDEKIILEVTSMGFKRGEVIAALLEGKKKSDDIVNFILTSNKINEESKNISDNNENSNQASQAMKLKDFLSQNDFDSESFEKIKNEFSKYFHVNASELRIKLEQTSSEKKSLSLMNTRNNIKENCSELFSKIYKKLIEEDFSNIKISQLRKMNILFRIREVQNQINNFSEKILIPFLKEIFVLERENCIDLQSEDLKENLDGVKKLLQNRMLINYIIIKDRSKAADILENLDIDQMEEFLEEFKVVENSMMTIRFILNSIDAENNLNEINQSSNNNNFSEEFIQNIRNIIYECLFVIHLSLHFITFYHSNHKKEKLNLDLTKYKKEYFEVLLDIIETQNKMIPINSELILLDEHNLIIIFSTIVESFDLDQILNDFVDKGGLRNILKLRKSQNTNYESFNDAKFKTKVVLDEAFRAFLFKIFEDEKMIEKNIENIIRYIFANIYNTKNESSYANNFRKKKQMRKSQDKIRTNNENLRSENDMESQIKSDDERNVNNNNNTENNNNNFSNSLNNNNTNYKSNIESAAELEHGTKTTQPTIEINFDDFMGIVYPIMPKNKDILISVLKKFCVLDKKIEKQIKSRKKTSTNPSEDVQVTIRLKQEYSNQIIQLANEMKNQIVREKDLNEDEDVHIGNNKDNNNCNIQNTPVKTKKDPQTIFKESSRKLIENHISNITKKFSQNMVNIINTIINQLWNLTTDMEKEIDKNFSEINSNFNKFNLFPRYIIDLDTLLIAFSNLINCHPSVLSIILKFHKKQANSTSTNKKNKVSFISFLIRKIFYILQFYKNCIQSDEKDQTLESLNKEKDDVRRKLGYEVNSHQSAMEAYRNHNIISYFMNGLCYKKKNMGQSENYLIVKARKKVLKEIDDILKEIKPKKEEMATSAAAFNSNVKTLLTYKITIFCLYSMTEFFDNSHLYHHLNPFEISRLLISQNKDHYEIVTNITETMKHLSLTNPFSFCLHRLSTLFISELLKFIRLNPKMNYKNTLRSDNDKVNEAKLVFKSISNSRGDLIIEADILEDENNLNREEGDIIMDGGLEAVENIINNLEGEEDEEREESNEQEEESENEDLEEEDEHDDMDEENEEDGSNSNSSEHDFFYSISSSENEDDSESGEISEEDEMDDDEDDEENEEDENRSESEEHKEDEGDVIQVNIDAPLDQDNVNDEDNEDYDEGEEDFSNDDEYDDEYMINDNEDHPNETSVRFDDEVNEFHHIDRDEDSESNSFESQGNIMYGGGRFNGTWGRARLNLNAFGSRMNNLTSILLNGNENGNIQEDHEDILFFNPTFDKTGKAENAIYFEENVTFPFMLYLMNDDLTEFTKPGIFISVINKLKKTQLNSLNSIFILRFISPFDRKTKRNLYFALNASKEKVITAYNKELNKLEVDIIPYNQNDQFRNFSQELNSLGSIKEIICKEMGIDLKELNVLKDSPKENTTSKENAKEIIKGESENNKDSQNKSEIKDDQKGNDNQISASSNENVENNISNKNRDEDLIDPEFLEHIPEDLREDVLQNQKKLMEDNTLVNQYYNPEDIDPDLLNEVNPELMPGVLNSNNNQHNQEASNNFRNNNQSNQNLNQQNEGVNNANIDSATFIYSLPIDIREEILLTSDLNFIRSLPQDLRDEAQRLFSLYDPDRLLLMNEDIAGSNNLGEDNDIEIEYDNQQIDQQPFSWLLNPIKENKKLTFTFKPPKYNFDEILSKQKHQKDQTSFIINTLDDDFIEKLIAFNIKFTCESSPKTKINNNQYWILINNLIQNSNLRYKILDLLFVLWILDSMCLKRLLRENEIEMNSNQNNNFNTSFSENILSKSTILRYLYELYVENKILEEFFYDDYDQFVKNFCQNYPKEMKKFFLETFYTDKGEYLSTGGKKYSISKNITWLKDLLKINFEKDENVLSNLIRIMITNSKSDIKKIFALKIFTNIVTNCVNTKNTNTEEFTNNNLSVSLKTIERVVDLFYNFETVLEINKDKKSNNPTQLLCELIVDDKCFKFLLNVLNNHIENLNKAVSYEMDHFFTDKNIDINVFSRPLPENVLFKIIKLVNQMNVAINKRSEKEEGKAANNTRAINANIAGIIEGDNPNVNANENVEPVDNNQMIVDVSENTIKEDEGKSQKKSEIIKKELNEFIKEINLKLIKCWEKLDSLLYEITKRMKEDQKIIDPKLNRLIPYLEAFITLSHLQFLPENKGQITLKPFIMEAAYKRTPRKTPQHCQFEIFDDFNEFFVKFCDKNKKVINLILRRYPKMFPPEILIKISKFLDLENKKKYFKFELRKLKTGKDHHINLRVRRDHIFMDSYTQLRSKKPEEIRGRLTITFIGEEAVDAGGVKREWFTLLSKEMFNPDYMLFKLAANGNTYMPNSESGMFESDHLELFSFIGKVIAKAIYDGFMLDCYFTRGFYKLIGNIPLTYHDMEDVDPQYFKNLKWLLETDISDMGELFTFSYEEDKLGKIEVIDLVPNGRNISVSEENKFEYVQKLCYAKLFDTIKPQMEALQKGFYEIIPLKLISIFDHRELELVISGLPTVDGKNKFLLINNIVQDLKNNTIYENYTTESQIIQWFWSIIDSWDNNERAEFLQFVTGSSKVPLEGFSALQGIGGINKFKISKVFDKNFDRLPTAHTWYEYLYLLFSTNQLDLPDYPSKEILFERINLAIREGKVGFGFI